MNVQILTKIVMVEEFKIPTIFQFMWIKIAGYLKTLENVSQILLAVLCTESFVGCNDLSLRADINYK